jgi:hypothetical protein
VAGVVNRSTNATSFQRKLLSPPAMLLLPSSGTNTSLYAVQPWASRAGSSVARMYRRVAPVTANTLSPASCCTLLSARQASITNTGSSASEPPAGSACSVSAWTQGLCGNSRIVGRVNAERLSTDPMMAAAMVTALMAARLFAPDMRPLQSVQSEDDVTTGVQWHDFLHAQLHFAVGTCE